MSERTFHPVLGLVFVIAGFTILILVFANYLQDGRLGISAALGLLAIAAGLFMVSSKRSSNN